jgi:hypothetical protein
MYRSAVLNDCLVVDLKKIGSRDGHITVVENGRDIPFDIKRIFYIYDIPGGESRGAHAHKECHQFIIAACGSFNVELNDGFSSFSVMLNRPYLGLYIPPGIWASEINFSGSSVCLVLTSHLFDEADYIRDFNKFILWKNDTSVK